MMAAMKIHHEFRYDASPDAVHAMLGDPAFRERVCEAQHVTGCSVSVDGDPAALQVEVDQRRPADGIPGFAKKFVGDEIQIVQRETWDGSTDAALSVTIPGKPGELHGTITLRPDGDGTLETVSGELSVSVPLVGGKLEKLVADILGAALRTEHRVGREWLG